MKILVVTQAVDTHHTTLGFFTRWIDECAQRFESVTVVCLYKGVYTPPSNVDVYSLGKENQNTSNILRRIQAKISYVRLFFTYIWKYRKEYDVVFVHMNQEYIILGGWLWELLGKKIFFWRNHPYGDLWTRIAVLYSRTVFCTADKSFTARYKKTVIMPTGVDTTLFSVDESLQRQKNSLLVFGRLSPVKRIEKAIDAVALLLGQGIQVELSIVGDWLPRDASYVEGLKRRVTEAHIGPYVTFVRGVDFVSAPQTYRHHEILLNFTDSGSFDKTVIEALACGTKVLVSNVSLKDILPKDSYTETDEHDIVKKLQVLLSYDSVAETRYHEEAAKLVHNQSLSKLMDELQKRMSQ